MFKETENGATVNSLIQDAIDKPSSKRSDNPMALVKKWMVPGRIG
jgi:hypothetical protein